MRVTCNCNGRLAVLAVVVRRTANGRAHCVKQKCNTVTFVEVPAPSPTPALPNVSKLAVPWSGGLRNWFHLWGLFKRGYTGQRMRWERGGKPPCPPSPFTHPPDVTLPLPPFTRFLYSPFSSQSPFIPSSIPTASCSFLPQQSYPSHSASFPPLPPHTLSSSLPPTNPLLVPPLHPLRPLSPLL